MRSTIIIFAALLLSACKTTELVPEPVTYNPPAILMQAPHKNKTIEKPAKAEDKKPDIK